MFECADATEPFTRSPTHRLRRGSHAVRLIHGTDCPYAYSSASIGNSSGTCSVISVPSISISSAAFSSPNGASTAF